MAMKEEEISVEGEDVKDDIGGSVECVTEKPKCSHLQKAFNLKDNLYRHLWNIHKTKPDVKKDKIICKHCSEYFLRHTYLYKHIRKEHGHDNVTKFELQKLHKSNPVQAFNFSRDINKSCYLCPICKRPFIRKANRDKHMKCHEKSKIHLCKYCYTAFASFSNYTLHEQSCSANTSREPTVQSGGSSNIEQIDDGNLEFHESAFNKALQVFRLLFHRNGKNLLDRLQSAFQQLFERITLEQKNGKPVKIRRTI